MLSVFVFFKEIFGFIHSATIESKKYEEIMFRRRKTREIEQSND